MPVQRKLYCYFMFTLILCVHTNAKNETVKKECPIVQHGSGLMEDKDCNKDLAWSDTDYMEYDELLIVNNSKISNLGDLSDIHVVQKVAAKKSDTFDTIFSGVTDDDESSGSIPPPQVEDIINDLENMLNGTDPIHIEDVDQIFDQIEDLLSGETEAFPGELIQLLERLGSSVNLESSNSDMIVKSNIALMVADANSDYSVRGLTVSAEGQNFNDKELKFLNGNVTEDILDSNLNEVVVNLPESLLDGPKRISFLLFSDGNALPYDGELAINSRVVNVNIREPTRVMNGEVVDIHLKPSIVPERNRRRSCGYWEYLDDATGHWSQEGCTFISSQNSAQLDTCKCERIGHYAEILVALPSFSETDDNALRILSITGSSLSIFGAIIIVFTGILFRVWRSDSNNQVWTHLTVSLFIMSVCFLVTVSVRYIEYSTSCLVTGVFLHYSVLVSFCWIFVAAINSCRDLVVYSSRSSHSIAVASIFSWGFPIILIGIYAIAATEPYIDLFEEKTPIGRFCYPSGLGLLLSVYIPMAVVLLINVILFFYVVGVVSKNGHIETNSNAQESIRSSRLAFVFVIIYSVPWIFGFFGNNLVLAYMFTITVSIKCFILFIILVFGVKGTRDLWLHKFSTKSHASNQPPSRQPRRGYN